MSKRRPVTKPAEPAREVAERVDADILNHQLMERLAELEMAVEASGWMRIADNRDNWDFTRDFLRRITAMSRYMYLKNPMVRRSVRVKMLYVFGLGFDLRCQHPDVQKAVDRFFYDRRNQDAVLSHLTLMELEPELSITGNLFFRFFINRSDGSVQVRTVDVDEIQEVRANPEDSSDVWFYRRSYMSGDKMVEVWYPSIDYNPVSKVSYVDQVPVQWDTPVYHARVGGLRTMRFGVPETFSSLDWALAYKNFLEDWATIMRAYARMAMQVSGLKGQKSVAAAKSKLQSTIALGSSETNPPNVAAGFFLAPQGVNISAVKTAGATTSAEEGRPLKLMVASATDLPDTFFGDADVGNYATSQTLDRPTELNMVTRQKLWQGILGKIISFAVMWSCRAPGGLLRGAGGRVVMRDDPATGSTSYDIVMPNNTDPQYGQVGVPISTNAEITFPSILERNATERVRAVVMAATTMGKPLTSIIPDRRLICRYLLEALGEPNIEDVLEKLYPLGEPVKPIEDPDPNPAPAPGAGAPDPEEEEDAVDSK